MKACLLYYDIPTGSKIYNPSDLLWRLGVRVNLSVWIIPEANVVRVPTSEWRSRGAKVELVRFDENDSDTIIRLAHEALEREAALVLSRLTDAHARLSEQYASAPTGDMAVLYELDNKAARYMRQARKFLTNAQECAATFMMLGDVSHLFDGLRESIKAHDALFFALKKKSRSSSQVAMNFISNGGN